MKSILVSAIIAVILAGTVSPAAASSSEYPFRYGFPDPPLYSYNPHFYWSYGSRGSHLDQRTLQSWQAYTGPDGTSAIPPWSYGSPATAARIQKEYGLPLPPDNDAPVGPIPFAW